MNKTLEVVAQGKNIVSHGPHLWVSKLLHQRGPLSSSKIWEEFLKDPSVEKELIQSKSFLKERILKQMLVQGKVVKAMALDMPTFKRGGWQVVPHKAFKNVAPDVLANMTPMPVL
jgi:hypothetical protein